MHPEDNSGVSMEGASGTELGVLILACDGRSEEEEVWFSILGVQEKAEGDNRLIELGELGTLGANGEVMFGENG